MFKIITQSNFKLIMFQNKDENSILSACNTFMHNFENH